MTAALAGFAVAGLAGRREVSGTPRPAVAITLAGIAVSAASPLIWVLVAARFATGLGIGLLVAAGLAEVPRRLPAAIAGRVTGAMISGTAIGGLLGRFAGYSGLFLGWRWAFVIGGAATLATVVFGLRALGPAGPVHAEYRSGGRAPLRLLLAGGFILFVSVGLFDLLPYRVVSPAVGLPPEVGDLVYLTFFIGAAGGMVAGRAVDRFGTRRVVVVTAVAEIALMAIGLLSGVPPLVIASTGAITGTVALHSAHSAWAASFGRAAVGRYLAGYYVGGAAAAPLCAFGYQLAGWPGVVGPCIAATAIVLLLAVTGQQPDRPQRQEADLGALPAGGVG